ncbi:MAG TPA: hypothetical protein PKO27_12990 [Deltaproteobacteria bacterium]|nr:hypothetical protein [Deltaproteobacteria bacterium]
MEKEYKFKIEAYTPETFPMARCAEYLSQLATVVGETPYVHFVRLESGCVELAYRVDSEAIPKVEERIEKVKRNEGTVVEMAAYRRMNHMLREDNGKAVITSSDGEMLRFPGKEETHIKLASVKQHGKIDGELIRVGGSKEKVPILLDVEGKQLSHFYTTRTIAKRMGNYLFEEVRLFGDGLWERNTEGEWALKVFRVDRFEVLPKRTISETVESLRKLKGEWGEDEIERILNDRHSDEVG